MKLCRGEVLMAPYYLQLQLESISQYLVHGFSMAQSLIEDFSTVKPVLRDRSSEGAKGSHMTGGIEIQVVTLISHLTDIECLDKNPVDKCPPRLYYNNKWKFYTFKLCRDEHNSSSLYYHCLQNESGGYIEFCVKPVNISAGHYPLWTNESGGFIRMAKCSMDTYQDIPMMQSNLFNKCIKTKSKCTEPGQLSSFCPDGGATADQQCRCNYKDGWMASQYVIENRHNNVCFIPSQQDSKCLNYFPCKEKEELNPAYQCVPKCPVGYHRPEMEYDCVKISSHGVPSTTDALPGDVTSNNMRTSTGKSIKSKEYNRTLDKSGFMVAVGVSLFILIVLLLVTSGIAVYKRCFSSEKKKNEGYELSSNSLHGCGTLNRSSLHFQSTSLIQYGKERE